MKRYWRLGFLALLACSSAPGFADEAEELRTLRDSTINLVNALVEQKVLTRDKADAIIAQALKARAKGADGARGADGAGPAAAPGVVRVPYVPETVKQEIAKEVKQDVLAQAKTERWGEPGAFPDWLRRFNWYGDVRLRAEADRFPPGTSANASVAELQAYGVNIANSTAANNRLRFRSRFGFDAIVGDTVTAGIRVSSGGVGSGSNAGSENQTIGNYSTRSAVGFDRAYISYHPWSWLEASGGRLGNPFFKPTTLIWADDLSLEGVVLNVHPNFGPRLMWFTTAGAFPILQVDPTPGNSAKSKWLYGFQTGVDLRFTQSSGLRLAAALYDYRHIEGIPNSSTVVTDYSSSAAPFRQTGNTVFDVNGLLNTQNGTQNYLYGLASKFHEANVSASLDLGFVGPTHIIIDGDWVKNLGFNSTEIEQRTGYQVNRQVKGWQTRVSVGYPTMQQKNAWQAYVGYRYAQRDSTVDAFTEQDFHLGGTDAQGYYLGVRYALEKNTFVNLRWFSAKQIDGVELAGADSSASGLPLAIDVAQLDLVASF
ncbi:MAG: putative porin [Pseudomonadota bacterium]|nr:putative porin [Pseudomonadota bacterium]